MLYLTCAACLDWSRCEDIQARIVKGRLSWTGRRYQAGTVRGRPNWFGSLLPEVQGTSSWCISWMFEQHKDQAQSVKRSSSAESRTEKKCREQTKNQLVKDKPAGQNLQGQIVKEYLSSEDDEGQLERRSADKRKLEDFLKCGCKQEETKRSLNGLKKQPARTRPARCRSD
ncbi:abscisic acid 8'-hydroxylase 2 [Dorcoceras hygrometricum]|uniref:Abscisic acid 8'-hydroxylase 2 n=1 Tax=Dorcoceras hygrometricum TaxID=472368 RepID=A0A2Z7C2Q6_9LAMI|nr:abscisic acid 8'-hydroxylase 2 [Dorcoceras hygrometricum]